MTTHKMRNILSVIIVGSWVLTNSTIVVMIFLDLMSMNNAIDLLKAYNSIILGVVGVIMGYYFATKD